MANKFDEWWNEEGKQNRKDNAGGLESLEDIAAEGWDAGWRACSDHYYTDGRPPGRRQQIASMVYASLVCRGDFEMVRSAKEAVWAADILIAELRRTAEYNG